MNYVVKCDGQTLYNEYSEDCFIIDDELELVANELGSFSFSIYPDHPLYNSIELKKSKIKLYKDDELMMIFRPMEQHDDINDLRTFYCEGCLSYLKDSLMRPFDFGGSPATFFHNVISQHNSQVSSFQRFIEGSCTVTDPNNYVKRSSTFYNQTWDIVTDKMLNMGGYLVVTFDQNENPILNWLASISDVCSQEIALGENLTSYERSLVYSDFCTACVPLGAQKADGTRLTIEDVNEDHDYVDYLINDDLAAIYGVIYAKPDDTTWDDVTNDWNLLTKGERWLDESGVKYKKNITLTAEDISFLNVNVDSFEFMKKVYFKNSVGVSSDYIIAKMSFAITNKYSLNVELVDESYEYVPKNFTAISTKHNRTVNEKVQKTEEDKVNKENILDALNDVASYPGSYFEIGSIGASDVYTGTLQLDYEFDFRKLRCFVSPDNGIGWYRIYKAHWACSDSEESMNNGRLPFSVDIALMSQANANVVDDAIHVIRLNKLKNDASFDCECSKGNALQIDKIRYVEDTNVVPADPDSQQNGIHYDHKCGYVDVHFASLEDYWTQCVFELRAKDRSIQTFFDSIRSITKVDDSPSDQTIVAEYTFEQNVNKFSKLKVIDSFDVSGSTSLQNTTVNGILDVIRRRCEATLSAAGWYRAIVYNAYDTYSAQGTSGEIVTIKIVYTSNVSVQHEISLWMSYGKVAFLNETSHGTTNLVDKIRYTYAGSVGYVDIHIASSSSVTYNVSFEVSSRIYAKGGWVAGTLASVDPSPSGETILTEYALNANGAYYGNVTVGGVLDVTPRRVYASLSSAGWYRILKYSGDNQYAPLGTPSFIIRLGITRHASSVTGEAHEITMTVAYNGSVKFSNENSNSKTLIIDKIRYTYSGNNAYVDIHYNNSGANIVNVDFDVDARLYIKQEILSQPFTSVAVSPSGETVLAEYSFSENVPESGSGYSKNPDGTMIQWGRVSGLSFTNQNMINGTVTLPQSFVNTNYMVLITPGYTGVNSFIFRAGALPNKVNTFSWVLGSGDSTNITATGREFNYLAIGRWK